MLGNEPASEITEADLMALIPDAEEGRSIDYKRAFDGTYDERRRIVKLDDQQKREFALDVSSFANDIGGYLVYGMDEMDKRPTGFVDLPDIDFDKQTQMFDSTLASWVQPRIPSVTMAAVRRENGNYAFVIHIPRSYIGPHAVSHDGFLRFCSRNSSGKYMLDVQ